MVRIKICGITNLEDALLAAELGADALGFIFYAKSPRHVAPETAREIIAQLPPFVAAVGVFVDEAAAVVQELAARVGLDWVQLHGQESPEYCRNLGRKVIKGFRIQDEDSLRRLADYQGAAQALLLDTYKKGQVGGTGEIFDWHLARKAKKYGHIILAGGLTRTTWPRPSPPPDLRPWTRPAAPRPPRVKRTRPSCGRFLRQQLAVSS